MFKALGSIIDDLYKQRLSGRIPRKKIVFLVGSGVRHISNILNDDQVAGEAAKRRLVSDNPKTKSFQEFKWRLFELARYYTANTLPTFAHACIHRMVTDKICRDVITTNYDLFFDSVWAKYPDLNIVQNPVAHRDEFLWDGYYSYRQKARGKPRYWKIHGSLSHVVFRAQTNLHNWQILRLPRFPISTNQPDLPKAFGAKCLAPFLGYESGIYPNTRFTHPYTLDPQFDPFIDWSYGSKRDLFRREIEGAKKVLKQRAQIAAVVIIGFRGYYNHKDPNDTWNEELVPILDGILNAGAPPVFMAIHEKQYAKIDEPTSQFMKRLENIDRCRSYKKVRHFLEALLYKYSKYFPYRSVGSEYAIWRTHWFLSMKEPKHA